MNRVAISIFALAIGFTACTGGDSEVPADHQQPIQTETQMQPGQAGQPGQPGQPAGPNAGLSAPVDGVTAAAVKKEIKPYRTFITIQRYNMEQNGDAEPISNVRIEIAFPNGHKLELPGGKQFWPIGNGQVQEINRTYELPFHHMMNDGFKFQIQMVRKGAEFLPCQFDVATLSEFNRSYVCHTDLGWQTAQKIPPEKQDKEGIQVRVFTDLNSKPNEIPSDALALK